MKYKRPGWYGESYRHYLASKGVPTVDWKKYAGVWKQKAVSPVPWFQKGCEGTKAKYESLNGKIKVTNMCTKNGKTESVTATAKPINKNTLEIDFGFGPFGKGTYEVVDVNKEYTKAVVRGGDGTTWVLERVKS